MENSVAAIIDRAPLGRLQIGLVCMVLLVLVIDGLDVQILALVAPVVIGDWGVSKAEFGPALAAALGGMAIGSFMGGWLGDRFGRRPVLLVAAALFGTVTILAGLAKDVPQLALLRLLSGVGFGAALPNGFALASEWTPARLKTRILTILSIGVPLGGMIGAPLTLAILPQLGWSGCFFVCGGITLAVFVAMLVFLPESPVHRYTHGDRRGAEAALSQAFAQDIQLAEPAVSGKSAHAAGPRERVLARTHLRMNAGSWLTSFCTSSITYAVAAWAPVLFTSNGFTLPEAIRASFFHNAAAIVAALSASFAINRFGSRLMLSIMLALSFLAIGTIGLIVAQGAPHVGPGGRTAVIALMAFLGATAGFATATVYSILSLGYPPAIRAAGIGAGLTWGRLGAIAMVAVGGTLLEAAAGGAALTGALAIAAVMALCGTQLLDRHIPPRRAAG